MQLPIVQKDSAPLTSVSSLQSCLQRSIKMHFHGTFSQTRASHLEVPPSCFQSAIYCTRYSGTLTLLSRSLRTDEIQLIKQLFSSSDEVT